MDPTSAGVELIHRYRIQPHTLILEVTGEPLYRQSDDVAILKPLRNAGIRIALTIGMGYSACVSSST